MPDPLLAVRDLSIRFAGKTETVHALTHVSFDVRSGEVLSLVGESGCGKSVTAMAIMGLLPRRSAEFASGTIRFGGADLLTLGERDMARIRGNRIGMVFQDPMTSLNPTLTIGTQIAEVVVRHRRTSRSDADRRALDMLDLVRIPDARSRLSAYPYEMSGGMRQRAMIAIALACDPDLLIADEPTTALDVTVQAQILSLIRDLKADLGMGVILITHDLGVVAEMADRVAVMYAGRIAEEGRTEDIFANPSHAYTTGLLQALPTLATGHRADLAEIKGSVPRLNRTIEGCVYAPRCPFAEVDCDAPLPPMSTVSPGHVTACIRSAAVQLAIRDHEIVRAWR